MPIKPFDVLFHAPEPCGFRFKLSGLLGQSSSPAQSALAPRADVLLGAQIGCRSSPSMFYFMHRSPVVFALSCLAFSANRRVPRNQLWLHEQMFCSALMFSREHRKCQVRGFLSLLLWRLIDGTQRHLQITREAQISAANHGHILRDTKLIVQQATNRSNSGKVVVAEDCIRTLFQLEQILHRIASDLNAGFFKPGANDDQLLAKRNMIFRQCLFITIQPSHRCADQLAANMRDPLPAKLDEVLGRQATSRYIVGSHEVRVELWKEAIDQDIWNL